MDTAVCFTQTQDVSTYMEDTKCLTVLVIKHPATHFTTISRVKNGIFSILVVFQGFFTLQLLLVAQWLCLVAEGTVEWLLDI